MQPINSNKNIAVLSNQLAGAGRSVLVTETLETALRKRGVACKIFYNDWPEHFYGFSDVFIVGGDGTLNYFINKYQGIQLPLAIFKGGTGNDFLWLLYGKLSPEEQLDVVLNANPRHIDIGKINNRLFINGVGIGFEGAVAKALTGKKKMPGKTSFLLAILKKIFTYRSCRYTITTGGKVIKGKKLLVDISNGRRAGGGFHIAPEAKADDGFFDLVIAEDLTPFQRLLYLPVIEKGKHLKLSFIRHITTQQVIIDCEKLMSCHLDGEYFEDSRLIIEMLPGALCFKY